MLAIKVNKYENAVEEASIDYSALFTGEFLVDIKLVNPPKEEYAHIRGLNEPKEVSYVTNSGSSIVKFVGTFDPNSQIKGSEKFYPTSIVVEYPIFISSKLATNKNGDKCEVIDQHNQTAWLPYDGATSAKDALTSEIQRLEKAGANAGYIRKMKDLDPETVRYAKQGETVLYDFLFNMTVLPRHNTKYRTKDGQEFKVPLEGFVIGGNTTPEAASKAFDEIVSGNVDYIRRVMDSKLCKHLSDGQNAKVGMMLGISVDASNPYAPRFYQDVLSNNYRCCTFKEDAKAYSRNYDGHYYNTHLSKEAFNQLFGQYAWKSQWQGSFDPKEYDKSTYTPPTNSETLISDPMFEDQKGENKTDDFPF